MRARDAAGNISPDSTTITFHTDVIGPVVSSVTAPADGTYTAGQALDFTVTFNEPVQVHRALGNPQITLNIGGSSVLADYLSGSGTSAIVFRHTVQSGENDSDGIGVVSLSNPGGSLADPASNGANTILNGIGSTTGVRVDSTAPAVAFVGVPPDFTYQSGFPLFFTIRFTEPVVVDTTGGTPSVVLDIGGTEYQALYASGSGGTNLTFTYTIAEGLADTDGIGILRLQANGGTIRDVAGQDASLTLAGVPPTGGVLIDGVRPTVILTGPAGASSGTFTVTATFSEDVTGLDVSDFIATNALVDSVAGGPSVYTVSLTPASSGPVTLALPANVVLDSVGNFNRASSTLTIQTSSVASLFAAAEDEISKIVTDQAARDLRARIAASQRIVRDAQDRLVAQGEGPPVNRALSFQGTLQADDVILSSSGSFGAETGLANGSRRILSGDFSLTRDDAGTVSARLDSTLAWEHRLSDVALAG